MGKPPSCYLAILLSCYLLILLSCYLVIGRVILRGVIRPGSVVRPGSVQPRSHGCAAEVRVVAIRSMLRRCLADQHIQLAILRHCPPGKEIVDIDGAAGESNRIFCKTYPNDFFFAVLKTSQKEEKIFLYQRYVNS